MTQTSFVFIRAMNTGARRLTNHEQLAPLVEAGFCGVAAYQASGNVVFTSQRDVAAAELDDLLSDAYGFETVTFVRKAGELRDVVGREPFDATQVAATAGRLQVAFMRAAPDADTIGKAAELVPDADLVAFEGHEWFWLPVDGISTSLLPVAKIERLVGPMTVRTLGTVERMLKKFG